MPAAPKSSKVAEEGPAATARSKAKDAPANHVAWTRVRSKFTPGREVAFIFFNPEDGKDEIRLQVQASAAGGSLEEAQRICRLCYLKMEEGKSKQEVEDLKKTLCDSLQNKAATACAGAAPAAATPPGARAGKAPLEKQASDLITRVNSQRMHGRTATFLPSDVSSDIDARLEALKSCLANQKEKRPHSKSKEAELHRQEIAASIDSLQKSLVSAMLGAQAVGDAFLKARYGSAFVQKLSEAKPSLEQWKNLVETDTDLLLDASVEATIYKKCMKAPVALAALNKRALALMSRVTSLQGQLQRALSKTTFNDVKSWLKGLEMTMQMCSNDDKEDKADTKKCFFWKKHDFEISASIEGLQQSLASAILDTQGAGYVLWKARYGDAFLTKVMREKPSLEQWKSFVEKDAGLVVDASMEYVFYGKYDALLQAREADEALNAEPMALEESLEPSDEHPSAASTKRACSDKATSAKKARLEAAEKKTTADKAEEIPDKKVPGSPRLRKAEKLQKAESTPEKAPDEKPCEEDEINSPGPAEPSEEISVPKCSMGHDMVLSHTVDAYVSYVCNGCNKNSWGKRWICLKSSEDYCFKCRPKIPEKKLAGRPKKNTDDNEASASGAKAKRARTSIAPVCHSPKVSAEAEDTMLDADGMEVISKLGPKPRLRFAPGCEPIPKPMLPPDAKVVRQKFPQLPAADAPSEFVPVEWEGLPPGVGIVPEGLPQTFHTLLILGPSGSGKSTLLAKLLAERFPEHSGQLYPKNEWPAGRPIVEGFPDPDEAARHLCSVGLSSVPAWCKPFAVLSRGEQYRANAAQILATRRAGDPAVFDEWTSELDRGMAKAASLALARSLARQRKKSDTDGPVFFATCHEDIVEYLACDVVIRCEVGMAPQLLQATQTGSDRMPKIVAAPCGSLRLLATDKQDSILGRWVYSSDSVPGFHFQVLQRVTKTKSVFYMKISSKQSHDLSFEADHETEPSDPQWQGQGWYVAELDGLDVRLRVASEPDSLVVQTRSSKEEEWTPGVAHKRGDFMGNEEDFLSTKATKEQGTYTKSTIRVLQENGWHVPAERRQFDQVDMSTSKVGAEDGLYQGLIQFEERWLGVLDETGRGFRLNPKHEDQEAELTHLVAFVGNPDGSLSSSLLRASCVMDCPFDGLCVHVVPKLPKDLQEIQKFRIAAIVGTSGSGSSTLAREMFGLPPDQHWSEHASVRAHLPTGEVGDELMTVVGLGPQVASRPMSTLSGGEQFRARLARSLAIPRSSDQALILEDFTCVLDRPAAQELAARLQNHVLQKGLQRVVVVSCHRDFIGRTMLEPDWLFETHSGRLVTFDVDLNRLEDKECSMQEALARHITKIKEQEETNSKTEAEALERKLLRVEKALKGWEERISSERDLSQQLKATMLELVQNASPGELGPLRERYAALQSQKEAAISSRIADAERTFNLDKEAMQKLYDTFRSSSACSVEEKPLVESFLVDNSELRSPSNGLAFRSTKNDDDKSDELAAWGSEVQGVDIGDGWLQVGKYYLPFQLGGATVILPKAARKVQSAEETCQLLNSPSLRLKLELRRAAPCEWAFFRKHHYKSGTLGTSAVAFVATLFGEPVAWTSLMCNGVNVISSGVSGGAFGRTETESSQVWREWREANFPEKWLDRNCWREHRTVVLPSFQGIGLGSLVADCLARLCERLGYVFVSMTVHPQYGGYRDISPYWRALPTSRQESSALKGNLKFCHAWVGATRHDGSVDESLNAQLEERVQLCNVWDKHLMVFDD
mmetsp:Transcript_121985/g.215935  ORF Transcript_121985/g.215935 Transcript_121985/m.215935 type:complete len:1759 (-) Transcript_121985:56-5332(-)